jgi:hypothetical protein
MKQTIIITLAVIALFALWSCPNENTSNSKTTPDSTTYWKDRYGTEHITRLAADANVLSSKKLLDSVKARINNKPQTITAVGATTSGTVKPVIDTIYLDSTTEYNFKYNDQWLSLDGTIGKSSLINYRFTDSIIITTYKKNNQTYIDGYSLNPNVHLTGITALRLTTDKQTRFAIGPYVGYGWNGGGGALSIGISLQYSILKF